MPDKIGTLAVGAWGDAIISELREGEFQLAARGQVTGRQQFVPVTVVKGGRVYRQGP